MSKGRAGSVNVAERPGPSAYNRPGARSGSWTVPAKTSRCPKRADRLIAAHSRRRRRLIHRHRRASAIGQGTTSVVVARGGIELINRGRSRADREVEVCLYGATGLHLGVVSQLDCVRRSAPGHVYAYRTRAAVADGSPTAQGSGDCRACGDAPREFERTDARVPVPGRVRADVRVIHSCVPECAIVRRVNTHRGVIAPAMNCRSAGCRGLWAGACNELDFGLRQLVERITD